MPPFLKGTLLKLAFNPLDPPLLLRRIIPAELVLVKTGAGIQV